MDHRDTSSSHGATPFSHGAHSCEEPIDNLVSKRKRLGKELDSTRETEEMIKKSKTTLDKDGLGMHNHPVEDTKITQTVHEIKAEASEEAAPAIELVPKTHTKKETLVDETLATPESDSDESDSQSQNVSTATGTSSHQFNNAVYIEVIIYNTIFTTYKTAEQPEPYVHGLEMRMANMEEMLESLKQDMCELKKGIKELKQGMDMILQVCGIDPITLQPMGPAATPAKDTKSTP